MNIEENLNKYPLPERRLGYEVEARQEFLELVLFWTCSIVSFIPFIVMASLALPYILYCLCLDIKDKVNKS